MWGDALLIKPARSFFGDTPLFRPSLEEYFRTRTPESLASPFETSSNCFHLRFVFSLKLLVLKKVSSTFRKLESEKQAPELISFIAHFDGGVAL